MFQVILASKMYYSKKIGNLNYPIENGSISQSISGPNSDEGWYPVPIKNASDYHEQLDQILPTQYELLLKKIMRKYKMNEANKNVKKTLTLLTKI